MGYVDILIGKYRSKGLLLDSNLLLLYLVGSVDPALVGSGRYNKLSGFAIQKVVTLKQLVSLFANVVTTPHILTEVSNLVGNLHDEGKSRIFRSFISTLEMVGEQEVSSYKAALRKEFPYLGLTDSVLAELSGMFLIVSNDGRMVNLLRESGIEALKWVEVLGLAVE